jgi:ATP-dependent Lon protease
LAEQKKSQKNSGQVICLVGPPGTGKTSLGKSIAEATGRKFASISLGGMQDVGEIQGHRRTYLGSMPGRIIQAMKKVGTKNPLILIDEIDKVSNSYKGDPSNALLEALDPNQNKKFIDNYLGEELPFDLSEVMFVCTANSLDLPLPLLDRMEIIHLSSYTEKEKFEIAKKYLIPEILKKDNLSSRQISFKDEALMEIIKYYTREAGVRELNRKIQKIVRKFIVKLLRGKTDKLVVGFDEVKPYLKNRVYDFTSRLEEDKVGVVNGLAYTGYGGEILPLEAITFPKKDEELGLTGNLGEIMRESAKVALNYVKYNHKKFGIDFDDFSNNSINIHAPEGAVPKDGPSAGTVLTSVIISALTGKSVSNELGMTGEITLHGKVQAIGGLKEKAIAAHRCGLKRIIIPKENEPDIDDIPKEVLKDLEVITVSDYMEIWDILFGEKSKKAEIKKTSRKKKV